MLRTVKKDEKVTCDFCQAPRSTVISMVEQTENGKRICRDCIYEVREVFQNWPREGYGKE